MIRACRPFDPEPDVVRDIDARIERQQILDRDDPPKLWVLLAEGILRQGVGGPDVNREAGALRVSFSAWRAFVAGLRR